MTTSLIENVKNCDMMQSLDASSATTNNSNSKMNNSQESTPRTITPNPYNGMSLLVPSFYYRACIPIEHLTFLEQSHTNQSLTGGPLAAASKMVPVPETLMSPDVCPASVAQRVTVSAINTQIQQTKTNKNKGMCARINSVKLLGRRI